jgi:hypothetical protein
VPLDVPLDVPLEVQADAVSASAASAAPESNVRYLTVGRIPARPVHAGPRRRTGESRIR